MTQDVGLLRAPRLLIDAETFVADGALELAKGRIVRVLRGRRELARRASSLGVTPYDTAELGDGVLTAGLVNAHAHLELTGLAGRTQAPERERAGDFPRWIRELLPLRAERGVAQLERDAAVGADRLVASGTTSVGDVDSSGAGLSALSRSVLRARVFREVLDLGDAERRVAALDALDEALAQTEPTGSFGRVRSGVSPHAPYTVSDELLRATARRAHAAGIAIQVHWAETEDEIAWLERGEGAFAELFGPNDGSAGCRGAGLPRLAHAGLLGAQTSLVHANHPRDSELEQVAAARAAVVHCPGSHAFFGRAPFAFDRWERAGVTLALGTDSLASNQQLDMRRELARIAGAGLAPARVWRMATEGGARALDLPVGTLAPGKAADAVYFAVVADARELALEALVGAKPGVLGAWVGGRRTV